MRLSLGCLAVLLLLLIARTASAGKLSCNIAGEPNPIAPTDVQVFKGTKAWVRMGINRDIGGIAVLLDLVNAARPASAINILDARSAGGAAWQTTIMVLDVKQHRRVNYNQAAGNSDSVWGYNGDFEVAHGFVQREWLPLFSNDYREGESLQSRDVLTSPCRGTSLRLGDGRMTVIPSTIRSAEGDVVRLANTYSVRASDSQDWQWLRADQALYLNRAAARRGNLRVYFKVPGYAAAGPVRAYEPFQELPRDGLRNLRCRPDDCFLSTQPISYALLVWRVGGIDLGIAIHGPPGSTFTGFLRLRPNLVCRTGDDDCGNLQWHSAIADSVFDRRTKVRFRAGEVADYSLIYDIGTVDQLKSLGFPPMSSDRFP